ncbi:AraC family transcriptional regulator [Rhodococcus sp. 14-2470-1b]|uniref:AraC family transcriptional regulator n=1 Tax=Rhodococcus sp. 14-2470-1b TaxID=2023149 RepID=UPI000B9A63F5|nr:AraC family transcriptional regulator [Rhodococcus sp. 14-2470-1b]OZF48885.1 AraC family transcriptional regulator [Rhodococcus sp. 14-2470-1b]
MADLISASSLTRVVELIEDCGGDPYEYCDRVGIDPAVIGTYDNFVPFSALSTLLGLCARELSAPDFALRLAARQDPDILGPVAIAARNAETVGDALRGVVKYAHVYSPALAIELSVGDTEASYSVDTVLHRLPHRAHIVELALGVTLTTVRMMAGQDFHPSRISFQHPRISELSTYREYFGCTAEFGCDRNALDFPRGVLHRHLPRVDPLAYDVAVRYMAGRDTSVAFRDTVSALIVRSLPAGAASLDGVAALMLLHPRTLQRRLASDGTTFETLADDSRRELALGLLANMDVPLSAVSRQLGYSEPSTLTRSVKRWFGVTPLAKRRELTRRY